MKMMNNSAARDIGHPLATKSLTTQSWNTTCHLEKVCRHQGQDGPESPIYWQFTIFGQ